MINNADVSTKTEFDVAVVKRLILSSAFEKPDDWIYLNRLWHSDDKRRIFYDQLAAFCRKNLDLNGETVILTTEGIYSSFGIIPFSVLLASDFGCFLSIWKEFGDVVLTTPKLFPEQQMFPRNSKVILFQDVVSNGTILRKIAPLILEKKWNLVKFFSAIYLDEDAEELKSNIAFIESELGITKIDFSYMIKSSDFGG